MNNVKLISVTPDSEKTIAYCARVSNPNNQDSNNIAKLLAYCIKYHHWSIFEMSHLTLEINTTRGLAAQILRHKSFSFQEFCMSGDTNVYFDLPNAVKKGKKQKYSLTLEHLYKNWMKSNFHRNKISNMKIRVFDQKTNTLTHSNIKEVFQTGIKDIFEITLENGKIIKSTKEHKVLTKNGFISLESAIGLNLINNTAVMSKNTYIGCNGVLLHQDYDWLAKAKKRNINNGKGVSGIAEDAGVSYHTVRKWLKKHNLIFSKKETAIYTQIWNKGKFGYNTGTRSVETRKKMSLSAKKGKDSNLWKGGVSSERKIIQADIAKYRNDLIKDYNYLCGLCNNPINGIIHIHHIVPVSENISLSRDYNNLMPVHAKCHMDHHKLSGDQKIWREKSSGNTMTVSWSKVKKVKYLGKQMTYDLEINHDSHNYIANGVIVHNSQRYADASLLNNDIPLCELRRQDTKNRQNSISNLDTEIIVKWNSKIREHFARAKSLYDGMLSDGIAKECARFVLPLATPTRLYMSGSLRSWITYIALREKNGTQKEHMDIAKECKQIFCEQFPIISEALGGFEKEWLI
jgi:thymidylate synthase (FAD)